MTVKSFVAKPRVEPARMAGALRILESGLRLGNALVAYSGGKDGLCAALLARQMGLTVGVCELSFTFAEQARDIMRTAERLGFSVAWRSTLDLGWLRAHPEHVFNRDVRAVNAFCQVRQRNSVESYARKLNRPIIVTGRKKAGNTVRFALQSRRDDPIVGCHPLREWDDGDVWAFLRESDIPVPWVYGTPFGQSEGNSAWPFYRQHADRAANYAVIYGIEPALVEQAALAGVVGAAAFLNGRAPAC